VLEVPPDPVSDRTVLRVPGFAVDAVDTDELDRARLNEIAQTPDEAEVLPLVEAAHRGREHEQRPAGMAEVEQLHVSAQGMAGFLDVVPLHLSGGGWRGGRGGDGEPSDGCGLAGPPSS